MKTKSLIAAIAKTGIKLEKTENGFIARGPKNYLSFYDQDGRVVCLSTCSYGDKSDSMTDYHAGCFWHTIKAAIKDLLA